MYAFPIPYMRKDPHADLELGFIKEYILNQGFTIQDFRNLPEPQVHLLIGKARRYAALRLADMETKDKS